MMKTKSQCNDEINMVKTMPGENSVPSKNTLQKLKTALSNERKLNAAY